MKYKPTTLVSLLDASLGRYPEKSLVMSTKRDGRWNETDVSVFRQQVGDFAMGLYALGLRPGDRVSIHSENSTQWVICDLATLFIGAVNVPIYTTQPAEQIKFILENSATRFHIVSDDEMFRNTKPLIKSIQSIEAVISLKGSSHKKVKMFDSVLEMGRMLSEKEPDLLDELKSRIKPDDLATLIYTSGTTGTPKGVMLSQNNIASNVQASLERVPFSMDDVFGQNVLSYLPLSHVFERMITYMYLVMGARVHYIEAVEEIREDFSHVKPFFFATVPRLLEKIHTGIKVKGQEFSGLKKKLYYWAVYLAGEYVPDDSPRGIRAIQHKIADRIVYSKIRELFGGNLHSMVSGGAALSPDIFRFINALGIYCFQGYGLTETSPVIAVQDRLHLRIGSTGTALTDVRIKVVPDGEIMVKGPNVMKGYFNDSNQTREVLTDDGWLHTGDVGRLDDEGNLFITDRKKSLFKLSTGKYVSPQNVETQLTGSGYIEQAIVLGYQKKYCSALVVPNYDNVKMRLRKRGYAVARPYNRDQAVLQLVQEEIDRANSNLTPWESVKRFALLEEPLTIQAGELTPTLKVKRNVVQEKYASVINSLYDED